MSGTHKDTNRMPYTIKIVYSGLKKKMPYFTFYESRANIIKTEFLLLIHGDRTGHLWPGQCPV